VDTSAVPAAGDGDDETLFWLCKCAALVSRLTYSSLAAAGAMAIASLARFLRLPLAARNRKNRHDPRTVIII
jgi:hypothetical protein